MHKAVHGLPINCFTAVSISPEFAVYFKLRSPLPFVRLEMGSEIARDFSGDFLRRTMKGLLF